MTAKVLLVQDEHDRIYGPTERVFNTTDEAVTFAAFARSCGGCNGEVVGVFDDDGEEVEFGAAQSEQDSPPPHSATKGEWEKYAGAHGVSYPSDATKQDIIDAVEGK